MNNNLNSSVETVKEIVTSFEKKYGEGVIRLLTDSSISNNVISSGSILLDKALGINGYPKGRIIEIFGPESSGKTTFSLHAIVEAQKLNLNTAFIDLEHSLEPTYAKKIGVDIEKLIISQPEYGEQALDILESLIKTKNIDLIVVDSVSALVPKKELESDIVEQSVGMQARLMSKALRKINGIISKNNCLVIFINQLREKVGVFFGNPETTSGGRALRFYSSLRIDLRKIETCKLSNGKVIGCNIRARIIKNKLSAPYKEAKINISFAEGGFNSYLEILNLGVSYNIIIKKGI